MEDVVEFKQPFPRAFRVMPGDAVKVHMSDYVGEHILDVIAESSVFLALYEEFGLLYSLEPGGSLHEARWYELDEQNEKSGLGIWRAIQAR